MVPVRNHCWHLPPAEAKAVQRELALDVTLTDAFDVINYVAGVDVAYHKKSDRIVGGVAILEATTLQLVETRLAISAVQFPYIPGLFSFRELPAIIEAMKQIKTVPDLIICDGHGIAHPQRFGLASHLGVLYDMPTIGCAKTRLTGAHSDPSHRRGSSELLVDNGMTIGAALRTQDGVRPVYVSTGHRVSLKTACDWIMHTSPSYRLPETTRAADHAVKLALKEICEN